MATAATPSVQHILGNIDSCDNFFMAQQGAISDIDMQQSQHSLSLSVQLQLNNIPLIGPLDAAAVTNRIGSSMFSDIEQQRIATVISNKVGHHAVPNARVQSLSKPLNYLSCFALAAVHPPSPHL